MRLIAQVKRLGNFDNCISRGFPQKLSEGIEPPRQAHALEQGSCFLYGHVRPSFFPEN